MRLQALLNGLADNIPEIEISGIATDNREVKQGFLFMNGSASDYFQGAIENGAVAVVIEEGRECNVNVPVIYVKDIRKAVSIISSRFYPVKPKNIAAVTGTNGKTSTVGFFKQLIEALGHKAATIGTLGLSVGDKTIEGGNTTPGAVEFHRTLSEVASMGIEYVAFEASSHGMDQHRTEDIDLKAAGFTNLTRDHIDYHKTMEAYLEAKEKLFTNILAKDGLAVLNADIPEYDILKKCGKRILSYGYKSDDMKVTSVNAVSGGQDVKLNVMGKEYNLNLKVSGHFQIMNILCAVGLVHGCGFAMEDIIKHLPNLRAPSGRMEFAGFYNGAEIYVDYAHTPDALENALQSLKSHVRNKLRVVFGSGGDRDPGKRPMMGKSAHDFADVVYVTDDNPRSEDAATIRKQVLAGFEGGIDAGDRGSAIKLAMSELQEGDVLLVAGKGHENYQIIKGVYYDFDDKVKILEIIKG